MRRKALIAAIALQVTTAGVSGMNFQLTALRAMTSPRKPRNNVRFISTLMSKVYAIYKGKCKAADQAPHKKASSCMNRSSCCRGTEARRATSQASCG